MWKLGAALAITTALSGTAWGQVIDVGPQTGTFSSNVRGFWFTAPVDFWITGVDVPTEASSGNFDTSIVRLPAPPPIFGNTTSNYTILHEARDQAAAVTGLNIEIKAGEVIGVLGSRDNVNSYGAGAFLTSILGNSVTLERFGSQNSIDGTTTVQGFEVWTESGGSISRIFLTISETGQIVVTGPTSAEELSALLTAAGGSARLVVLNAQGVARDLGQASIVARGDQLTLELVEATDGDDVVVSSKSGTPGLVGNLYTWAQITGFDSQADEGPGSINGTGFQIGADMAVGTDMVAGLSLGYSDINASDVGFSQNGTLAYLQPYFSYRAGTWQGNASLIFGQGDYDQTSESGEGSGETELFAFTFEGGYDMALQNGLTVTPMVGLTAGNEKVTGNSGTLAGAGTESYDFAQASLGARLTLRKPTGIYFAGLHADYLDQDAGTVLTSEFLSENGWSGRIEVGGTTQLEGGFGLSTSFDVSGIGGSAQTLSGGLRVALKF